MRNNSRLYWLTIAITVAAIVLLQCYLPADASTTMMLRLYHDQDASGTVSAGDIPAAGVDVVVTEATCTGNVCAASPVAYTVTTDSDGYVSLTVDSGEYSIEAPCLALTVQASDVSGQATTEWATCGRGLWLPVVSR